MATENDLASNAPEGRAFVTTRWSVVANAGRSDSTGAHEALSHLCRIYWYPLYSYVRRRGYSAHDSQDLTQAFFAQLLEHNWVGAADRTRGKFRTFLLTAISRFLSGEWDKQRAQKRGGGVIHVPLQLDTAETRYGCEPSDDFTPEQCFERRWALALLDNVLQRLREEHEAEGKGELFTRLSGSLIGDRDSQPYADLGNQLGMSEGAVKVAVHRLRKRYRELLRMEIAETVEREEEIEGELRHLFTVLARR